MGIAIVVSGASFIHNIGRAYPPYFQDLLGFYLLGSNQAESAMNRAPGAGAAATPVGTISYQNGYIDVDKASGFDTGLLVPNEFTQVAVFRRSSVSNIIGLVGSWNQGTYTDTALLAGATSGNAQYQLAIKSSIRGSASETGIPVTGFQTIAGTHDAAGGLIAYSNAAGNVVTNPYTFNEAAPNSSWRVGAMNFGTNTETVGLAAGLLYKRALSAAELTNVHAALKEMLAERNVLIA